jgi:hypothetical protein
MKLLKQSPTTRRQIFAACAGAPDSPMTPAQKDALLTAFLDAGWSPTHADTPVPFLAVETWYHALEPGPVRTWVRDIPRWRRQQERHRSVSRHPLAERDV